MPARDAQALQRVLVGTVLVAPRLALVALALRAWRGELGVVGLRVSGKCPVSVRWVSGGCPVSVR